MLVLLLCSCYSFSFSCYPMIHFILPFLTLSVYLCFIYVLSVCIFFFHYPLSPSPRLLLLFHPSLYFPIFILFSTLSPMPLCLPFVLLLLQQLLLVLLRLKTSLELDENSPRHHSGIFCRLGTACGIRSSQLSQNIQARRP